MTADKKVARIISIFEAAARGIERVRAPTWADPLDHLKIDICDGRPGPWLHLYAPFNKECNGRDPIDIFILEVQSDTRTFLPYMGPLPDSAEYKAAVAGFEGCLSKDKLLEEVEK